MRHLFVHLYVLIANGRPQVGYFLEGHKGENAIAQEVKHSLSNFEKLSGRGAERIISGRCGSFRCGCLERMQILLHSHRLCAPG